MQVWRLLAFGAAPAAALDYPTRPITLIVSHVAGGPSDVIARVLEQHAGSRFSVSRW